MGSKKIALDKRFAVKAHLWNSQNDQLPSSSSHCDHLTERSYDELMDALWFQPECSDLREELILYHIPEYLERQKSQNPGNKVGLVSVKSNEKEKKIQDYCGSQKMLLVGEGDFSFSICLAKAFGSATNMVATSLNSEAYLRKYYRNAMANISQLRVRGCLVLHEVDATDLSNHGIIKGLKFDRIIYNFPHCGDFLDSEEALRENQILVRLFMENSAKLITKDGEIHIRHKCNRFFRRWNLRQLASQAGLRLRQETPFDASVFEGYTTKYGFEGGKFKSDKDFDCHSSCTYKFVLLQKKPRKKNNKATP